MIFCKELNKEFDTKELMFAALKANKDKIIGLKKASVKESEPVHYNIKGEVIKADNPTPVGDAVGIGSTIYPIINTTNYLDSHGDVHIDGIWDVSIKDQKGKVYYIINHCLEIGNVIAYPNNVDPYIQTMKWTDLGLSYTGTTQALIFKSLLTDATNKDALAAIVDKAPIQNSIRMQYIALTLCIDDSSPDYAQEYANFYKYLSVIANKQDAIDQGYFWAVTEAKIYKEGSAVLFGSNDCTPICYEDPAEAGQKDQQSPQDSSLVKSTKSYINLI